VRVELLAATLLIACSGGEGSPSPERSSRPIPEAPPPVPPEKVYAPGETISDEAAPPRRTVAAFERDRDFAGEEQVEARRLVYRVRLRIPRSLGEGHAAVHQPAAELYLDVSSDRLRARFVGTGWPVPEGSEIRIRRDAPGAYVFDGRGGRPLGPGQMAHWFEGGRPRGTPSYRVAPPPLDEQSGPGDLVCRLVAEWTGEGPTTVARRCGEGGSTPSFRVGLWLATRTADVGVRLPRRSLRADHLDPPSPPAEAEHAHAYLTEASMRQLQRIRGAHGEPADDAPERGLVVVNRGPTRIIVTVRGTPIGWIDAGHEHPFPDIPRGSYQVGALRPFGLLAAGKRPLVVPGRVLLPRWIRPTTSEDP
jgi:hypothetical protein